MEQETKANTGPKTPEGKRTSSLNALKHGLSAKSQQAQEKMAEEFELNFEEYYRQVRDFYQPEDIIERKLVQRITDCLIKLERCRLMENKLLARSMDSNRPNTSLQTVQRYESNADLLLHWTIATLTKKKELSHKRHLMLKREKRELDKEAARANKYDSISSTRIVSCPPERLSLKDYY